MWPIPTRPYFRALYCKRYTRWINGLGTRLTLGVRRPGNEASMEEEERYQMLGRALQTRLCDSC